MENIALKQRLSEAEMANVGLNQRLQAVRDFAVNIDTLNVEQLNELKKKFEAKLEDIHMAKLRLFEDHMYCMICMEHRKNVVIQGCNHFVLCDQCEQKLEQKRCPQCQITYTNVLKLSI